MQQFPREATRPRMLVFLTDGLPTVGDTAVSRIQEHTRQARRPGVRLFTFGVGYDVNTRLLDRVAAENGGTADYVEPREDLEQRVSNFFDKVNHPVLTNVRVDMGPVRSVMVYPRELPDLFRGTQLAMVGRYRNAAELRDVAINLSGDASPTHVYSYPGQRFPLRAEANDWLPRLWATRRVGWLMEQIRSNGEQRELVDEVTELGTRYGLVTPYTSYLALEPGEQGEDRRERPMPRPMINGQQPATSGGRGALRAAAPEALAVTGQAAVEQSRSSRNMQDATTVAGASDAAASSGTQHVGGKTFHLEGGIWRDTELRAGAQLPVTSVRFGTDEYYALLERVPALGRYFALGQQVDVLLEGRIYRVRTAAP
jgi:Ca-activated chloride channel family protein